ncbi:glucose dehydrogenase [Emticicia aquatilis]|uniref:Glucose dehydrogenase n=1 Tax=Emticicia aquatilis TaxID=1537369 RepID=A0A917DJG0_9BACT|nr:PQQ-dependent sugar dehydrogenase [Emticicia aquatilis]GGD42011.1 glucose dehydrogenase [Emticicia aquatilis]
MKKTFVIIGFCGFTSLLAFRCREAEDAPTTTTTTPTTPTTVVVTPPTTVSYQAVEAFPKLSFNSPVDFTHANDGTNRVFVVEQRGVIQAFENSTTTETKSVFLDITSRVASGGEMGLLGVTFHPDFKNNGFFFVNYTRNSPRRQSVIARFKANGQTADPSSETILFTFDQPYTNHNGGQLAFGADGYLYIATGDGGSGGDPENYAQNRASLLGKMLRIDVNSTEKGNYGIPKDNPYVANTQGFREEIYAYGLRNPWRFSFDSVTKDLWTGDVGQNKIEEIDIITKGGNYGWKVKEGSSCYSGDCSQTNLIAPVWEYQQGNDGRSVTGGIVYRGKKYTDLVGKYFCGDYVSGKIWALTYDGKTVTKSDEITTVIAVSAFGQDANGEIYILNYSNGKVYTLAKK